MLNNFSLFYVLRRFYRSRKEEIQALSGPNEFTEFYLRLKNIRQYYPKNSSEEVSLEAKMRFCFLFIVDYFLLDRCPYVNRI